MKIICKRQIYVYLVFFNIVIYGCGNIVEDNIFQLTNDTILDMSDFKQIKKDILADERKYKYLYSNGILDDKKVIKFIGDIYSSRNRSGQPLKFEINNAVGLKKINVFVENSYSMVGYIAGHSEYESNIEDLLSSITNKIGNGQSISQILNLNFINTKIYHKNIQQLEDVGNSLDEKDPIYHSGEKGNSNLNNVFRQVLELYNNKELSILITDNIYSIGKINDINGELSNQSSLTFNNFSEALHKNKFGTLLLQFFASYYGPYYDKDLKIFQLNGEKRPYYIWVFGNESNLKTIFSTISNDSALANFMFFSTPNYKVLPPNFLSDYRIQNGRFKDLHEAGDIPAITIKPQGKDFQFSISLDLSDVIISKNYILDKNHYKIDNGWKILSVIEASAATLTHNEKNSLNNVFDNKYVLTLSVPTASLIGGKVINIALLKSNPSWVNNASTLDDSNVKQTINRTLGLHYFVDAVQKAYTQSFDNNNILFNSSFKIDN